MLVWMSRPNIEGHPSAKHKCFSHKEDIEILGMEIGGNFYMLE